MTIPAISEMALQSLFRALAEVDSYVFLESTKTTPENHQSLLFLDPQERLTCKPDDNPYEFFKLAQKRLDQGFFLAGYIGYEFGYLLEPSLAKCLLDRPLFPQSSAHVIPVSNCRRGQGDEMQNVQNAKRHLRYLLR